MHLSYRWRSRPDAAALERNVDELRTVMIQLRHELTNKTGYAATLELVLKQRTQTIDDLRGKLDQLRASMRVSMRKLKSSAKWSDWDETAKKDAGTRGTERPKARAGMAGDERPAAMTAASGSSGGPIRCAAGIAWRNWRNGPSL